MGLFKKATQTPSIWKTKNLIVSDTDEKDLPVLEKIMEQCSYIEEWTGLKHKKGEMLKEFRHEILPPKGKKHLHRLQTIALKKTGEIIGYTTLYHGYLRKDIMWIGLLSIAPHHQGKKYGKQFIQQFAKEMRKVSGVSHIGLGVALKNWPAMRFWIANGFTEIMYMEGAKKHGAKDFADIFLLKKI